jgi:hypothetical protein
MRIVQKEYTNNQHANIVKMPVILPALGAQPGWRITPGRKSDPLPPAEPGCFMQAFVT